MSDRMDIEVPRNGDYYQRWYIEDDQNIPISIVGATLELAVKTVAGDTGVVATGEISNFDYGGGSFDVKISGSDFSEVEGKMDIVRLAYDCRITESDGVKVILVYGHIILVPGVV